MVVSLYGPCNPKKQLSKGQKGILGAVNVGKISSPCTTGMWYPVNRIIWSILINSMLCGVTSRIISMIVDNMGCTYIVIDSDDEASPGVV